MKILILDLESAPNVVHTWGLWNQNIGINQILSSGRVLCFAAKWAGEKKIMFHAEWESSREEMLRAAWELVNEADVVVGFNHVSFDMPWFRGEWARMGWTPPSPYQDVDLKVVSSKTFRFPSNKLDYLSRELLGDQKVDTGGHELWLGVLNGDRVAQKKMKAYNRNDVILTEKLFDKLRPWIRNLPNPALYGEADPVDQTCPECGSGNLTKEGFAYTKVSTYQRYSCDDCGRWSRGAQRVGKADLR